MWLLFFLFAVRAYASQTDAATNQTDAAAKTVESATCPWGGYSSDIYSWAKPRKGDDKSYYCGRTGLFNQEAQEARDGGQAIEVVFYGDSITSCYAKEVSYCPGAVEWFQQTWQSRFNAHAWSVRRDTIGGVMWRLLNGNDPQGIGAKAVVLLIGTNDVSRQLDKADDDIEVAKPMLRDASNRLRNVTLELLQRVPGTRILIVSVLPRSSKENGQMTWQYADPLAAAITAFNKATKKWAKKMRGKGVVYVGCNPRFLEPESDAVQANGAPAPARGIRRDLVSDGVHLHLAGHEELAACLEEPVRDAVGH